MESIIIKTLVFCGFAVVGSILGYFAYEIPYKTGKKAGIIEAEIKQLQKETNELMKWAENGKN